MKRIYSIKSKDDLDLIFKEKKSVGNGYFVIYKSIHDNPHFKYAISIGKKFGNAVERNQAKRRLRYIVSNYSKYINPKYRFVIVVRPQSNLLPFDLIKENIIKLLIKAKIIEKEVQN